MMNAIVNGGAVVFVCVNWVLGERWHVVAQW